MSEAEQTTLHLILLAAMQEFLEKGYKSASLRNIVKTALLYAYEHLNEFKLILCCSEGTRFSKLIDEMVEIETKGTHDYLAVLEKLGRPAPPIDERLEHILITGMFNTFFELIIHEMPLEEAKHYLKEMRAFYTAGWMKIMGQ